MHIHLYIPEINTHTHSVCSVRVRASLPGADTKGLCLRRGSDTLTEQRKPNTGRRLVPAGAAVQEHQRPPQASESMPEQLIQRPLLESCLFSLHFPALWNHFLRFLNSLPFLLELFHARCREQQQCMSLELKTNIVKLLSRSSRINVIHSVVFLHLLLYLFTLLIYSTTDNKYLRESFHSSQHSINKS